MQLPGLDLCSCVNATSAAAGKEHSVLLIFPGRHRLKLGSLKVKKKLNKKVFRVWSHCFGTCKGFFNCILSKCWFMLSCREVGGKYTGRQTGKKNSLLQSDVPCYSLSSILMKKVGQHCSTRITHAAIKWPTIENVQWFNLDSIWMIPRRIFQRTNENTCTKLNLG